MTTHLSLLNCILDNCWTLYQIHWEWCLIYTTSSVASNFHRSLSMQTRKMGWCSSFISLSNLCYSVVSCPIVNMISLTLLAGSLTFSILCKERCKIKKISSASLFLKHTFLSVRPQLYRFVGDGSITRTYFNSYQIGCEFQFPFHFQYSNISFLSVVYVSFSDVSILDTLAFLSSSSIQQISAQTIRRFSVLILFVGLS